MPAAVIGTVGTRVAGEDVKTDLTTPEAPDLHGLFAMMRERGVAACAMEVSSHALVMGRVDGVVFDVAVFTNLGRDHLDFHARPRGVLPRQGVPLHPRARPARAGQRRRRARPAAARESTIPVRTFSATGADADWRAIDVELAATGSRFVVRGPTARASRPGSRCPATSTSPTRSRRSRRAPRRGTTGRRGRRRHRRRCRRTRAAGAGRGRPGLRGRRRLRPQARRRRVGAADAPAPDRRAGCSW